jgi:hypothetical protein
VEELIFYLSFKANPSIVVPLNILKISIRNSRLRGLTVASSCPLPNVLSLANFLLRDFDWSAMVKVVLLATLLAKTATKDHNGAI